MTLKRGGNWLARLLALAVGCALAATAALPRALATAGREDQDAPSVLRVAFYPLEGFFEYDGAGNETGYGVELLTKLSQYTGIQFTYVRANTWEDTKRMLLSGEADLRMPATAPVTPSATLSYGAASIIDTYHVILALASRDDLYYQDYDTIRTLKIAIPNSFYQNTTAKGYLRALGVDESQFVFCDEYDDCYQKLLSGEADALASNIMDMNGSLKMLARFNSISNYFSMTLNNPMLEVLNEAVQQIKLDEPLFLSTLYAAWFPERTVVPFTMEESEYLATLNTLTFAFRPGEGYLSRYEDGAYYGIYVEQAKAVCQRLGLAFRAVSIDECLRGESETDVYCGFFYNQNFADDWGFAISTPINDINYYMIQKKETPVNEKTCRVASVQKFYYTKEYLQKKYRPEQFVYFDTYEECLKAVAGGRAEIAVINNYIAEYYLEMYQFSDLSARLTSEYSHLYCFAAEGNNRLLASILSKALAAVSKEEMNQLYIRGMEKRPDSNYFLAFLYRDPLLFTGIAGGITALLIVLALMVVFIHKSNRQNAALEKALSAKSEFLARMSHDMRTPLNAVLGFARLAKEEDGDAASVRDSVEKIESSGEYLLGLINDVLDAAKIESGKVELHYEIVNGPAFLESIAQELKAQGQLYGVALVTDLKKADTPYVKMDKLRTHQIYANLLNNAFKFSQPGSTVEWYMEDIRLDDTSMMFTTTITDHGCGMSEEFMRHMFEPFEQERLAGQEQREGTGLGLTIVKKFVELAGGTITAQSRLGEGTVFTIRMRREIPTEAEIEAARQSEQTTAADFPSLCGKRVLLCEDHPLNREIAVRILKKVGVAADCAKDGLEGVSMLKRAPEGYYDAILMDVRMPVMNGLEAARTIRALNRADAQTVPIIAVTANAYGEDAAAAWKAGIDAHLPKPIDPKRLYQTLLERTSRGKEPEKRP